MMLTEVSTMTQRQNLPWATIVLAGINILVYIVMLISDKQSGNLSMAILGGGALLPEAVAENGQYYRLITAAFLHFGETHLMNNMLMLAVMGDRVERALGRFRYVLLYLACAVAANLASVFWYLRTEPNTISAGASGATMGLSGALLAIVIRRRRAQGGVNKRDILIAIGMSILCTCMLSNVNNVAHISGLAVGFILGMIFA